ncbi:hypothetical protein RB195_018136 [Necator americanus]|uniref:Uncharacterized protein n=1 Tax=Necator americanus TaxID=51031 RepID=A0ABR1C9Y0_NECAM
MKSYPSFLACIIEPSMAASDASGRAFCVHMVILVLFRFGGAYLLEATSKRLPFTSQSLDCRLLAGPGRWYYKAALAEQKEPFKEPSLDELMTSQAAKVNVSEPRLHISYLCLQSTSNKQAH